MVWLLPSHVTGEETAAQRGCQGPNPQNLDNLRVPITRQVAPPWIEVACPSHQLDQDFGLGLSWVVLHGGSWWNTRRVCAPGPPGRPCPLHILMAQGFH